MAVDERVWLTHPEMPGSAWHCPVDAVDAWAERGWIPGDAPVPVNPTTPIPHPEPDPEPATVDPGPATSPAAGTKATSSKGAE